MNKKNIKVISKKEFKKIELLEKIGEGSYANLYKSDDIVYKIFKENEDDEEDIYEDEIHNLERLVNFKNGICVFPNELLKDENGNFIGYTMDFVKGENISDIIENIPFEILKKALAEAIQEINELSKKKIRIEDLQIIWEEKTNSLRFIDTDQYYISEHTSEDYIKENNLATLKLEIESAIYIASKILDEYLKKNGAYILDDLIEMIDKIKTIAEKDFGKEFNSLVEIKEEIRGKYKKKKESKEDDLPVFSTKDIEKRVETEISTQAKLKAKKVEEENAKDNNRGEMILYDN